MGEERRRGEDVFTDLAGLLNVSIRAVDVVLHYWDRLDEDQRSALFDVSLDARWLGLRLTNALGDLAEDSTSWVDHLEGASRKIVIDQPQKAIVLSEDSEHAARAEAAEAKGPLWELAHGFDPMQKAMDVTELFARMAQAVASTLAGDACIISLYDEEKRTLRDVAGSTPGPTKLNVVVDEYDVDDFPATKRLLETDACMEVSVNDVEADASERRLLGDFGFSRLLMCPLKIDDEIRGTIEVYRVADRPFRYDDPERIKVICGYASNAYTRIKLSDRLDAHYTRTIETLSFALEARDAETRAHTGRITDIALGVADALRVPSDMRRGVQLGAILHDVGKIGVPDSILLKPGPLTTEEWDVMRRHPLIGERLLANTDFLSAAVPAVRHHHERWDGNGYPSGLAGEDIPIEARIVAVCDAFDAMTSPRPYRKPLPLHEACAEIERHAGSQFDPGCAGLLIEMLTKVGENDVSSRVVRYAS